MYYFIRMNRPILEGKDSLGHWGPNCEELHLNLTFKAGTCCAYEVLTLSLDQCCVEALFSKMFEPVVHLLSELLA